MQDARVRAVTMWDFSWLERRWPGAGFEDWGQALDELIERGYDCIRIDAYPHLVAADPRRTWTLLPCWTTQDWGAPGRVKVEVMPALVDFVTQCAQHNIEVALSSWFRRDTTDARMRLTTPRLLGEAWLSVLDTLDAAGLLNSVLWVDLCNEFPLSLWAPFVWGGDQVLKTLPVAHPTTQRWMKECLAVVRERYPDTRFTFSFSGPVVEHAAGDVSFLDLLEPHIWMAAQHDFQHRVGYESQLFDLAGYEALAENGHRVYLENKEEFDEALEREIGEAISWSRSTGLPLATTECWSLIDYRDWPGLEWDWLKTINETALRKAAASGSWMALATSNFAAPQFRGMWNDIDYHQRLTSLIHNSPTHIRS